MTWEYCIRPKWSLYKQIFCLVILSERLPIRWKSVQTGLILDTSYKRKHLLNCKREFKTIQIRARSLLRTDLSWINITCGGKQLRMKTDQRRRPAFKEATYLIEPLFIAVQSHSFICRFTHVSIAQTVIVRAHTMWYPHVQCCAVHVQDFQMDTCVKILKRSLRW